VVIEPAPDRRHTAKADLDNIAKSVLDGLNGVAFYDDRQVAELLVVRVS
jgi:Holliday junction resolvase RusA-like endonuclease